MESQQDSSEFIELASVSKSFGFAAIPNRIMDAKSKRLFDLTFVHFHLLTVHEQTYLSTKKEINYTSGRPSIPNKAFMWHNNESHGFRSIVEGQVLGQVVSNPTNTN